jgi:hypothetical protein
VAVLAAGADEHWALAQQFARFSYFPRNPDTNAGEQWRTEADRGGHEPQRHLEEFVVGKQGRMMANHAGQIPYALPSTPSGRILRAFCAENSDLRACLHSALHAWQVFVG